MNMKNTNKIGSVVKSNNSVIAKLPKYNNVDIAKLQILQDNADKSGIYLFTNLINGKRYIGSSQNLRNRFLNYLNTKYLLRNTCMNICKAFLKYGYSNFSLTILEYCEPSKCLEREGYYQQKFNPEYNLAKEPGAPMSGRKHSDETKILMSDNKKGKSHPNYGKARYEGSGRPSQQISVIDNKTNQTTTYDSISEAARVLNISKSGISEYFRDNQQKPYKGQYTFNRKN
jgi:hypothetical protein